MRCGWCGDIGCECDCPMCEQARQLAKKGRAVMPAYRDVETGRTVTLFSYRHVRELVRTHGVERAAAAYDLQHAEVGRMLSCQVI